MWVYALDLFVLQLPSTTLRIHIIILIFHKRKLAQRRRAQPRSHRVWVEWGVSSGLSSLLILGTFQSPVCIPLHSFLLTTEKLQSLSNKPGPLWQSPKTLLGVEAARMPILPLPGTFPPHISKLDTWEPFPSPAATPGLRSAFSSEWRWRRARVLGLAAEAGRCGGLSPGRQARAHTTASTSPCPRLSPARAPVGHTALRGLKLQHPEQGLKMQSRGWAGGETCRPNRRSGRRSRILPLRSAVLQSAGAGATPAPGGAKQARAAPSQHRRPLLPLPPRVPAARAEGRGRRVPGAYLCDSHAGTRGAAGRGRGVRGRRPGSACGPGGGGKGSPRAAGGSAEPWGPRSGRAGSAQGPLVGARPPLAADVSPNVHL